MSLLKPSRPSGKRRTLEVVLILVVVACATLVLRPQLMAKAEEKALERQRAKAILEGANSTVSSFAQQAPLAFNEGLKAIAEGPTFNKNDIAYRTVERTTARLEKNPKDAKALYQRSVAYGQLDAYDSAAEDLDRLIEIDPDSRFFNDRGYAQAQLGDFEAGLKDVKVCLAEYPDNVFALDTLGYIYVGLGRHQEAIKTYTKVIDQKPDGVHSLWGRAAAYRQLGNAKASAADFERAAKVDPDFCLHWSLDDDPGQHAKR